MLTLVPAYGRDYESHTAVLKDWIAKKDFLIQDMSCKWNGSYIGIGEADSLKDVEFKIRYNKLTRFCIIKKVGDNWFSDQSLKEEANV